MIGLLHGKLFRLPKRRSKRCYGIGSFPWRTQLPDGRFADVAAQHRSTAAWRIMGRLYFSGAENLSDYNPARRHRILSRQAPILFTGIQPRRTVSFQGDSLFKRRNPFFMDKRLRYNRVLSDKRFQSSDAAFSSNRIIRSNWKRRLASAPWNVANENRLSQSFILGLRGRINFDIFAIASYGRRAPRGAIPESK